MTHSISRRLALLCCASALLLPLVGAHAQPFPNKPITLVVPWPAGGSTDRHFRTLSEIASKHLGQTIVVENKPGAGGTLGPSTVALTAKPDGYTIAQYPLGMLRYPHMQKVNWDPIIRNGGGGGP
jgi:tripartite-type tricarboxylate transporter receptor subunit TctC